MDRRDFVNKAKIISAGTILVPSLFYGCDKGDSFFPDEKEPEKYVPIVNDKPYFDRDYYFQKESSSSPTFIFDKALHSAYIINKNHDLVSGLESIFYGDRLSKKKIISVSDSKKKYLPNILNVGNNKGLSYITMLEKEEGDIRNGGIGSEAYGLFIKQIKDGLPSWDSNAMCEKPGMIYLGDWSFNNVKQLNTNLNKGSALITLVAPNPASAAVFAATAKVGIVLEKIDFFIDAINFVLPFNLEKDKQYSIYQFPFDPTTMFISIGQNYICSQNFGDINDLFPLHPKNSWTYKDNKGNNYKWEIKGEKEVNGKNLLFAKGVDGTEEYFGFNGSLLGQYGIKDPSLGNIFFNPPLKMGDDKINVGKSYDVSSKIICENYPEITGTVKGSFSCEKRESVVLSNGKPYGDCFKMEEESVLSIRNGDKVVSLDNLANHWYAKNVGKVKMEMEGIRLELTDSLVNTASKGEFSNLEFSFAQKIIKEIKNLI